MSLQEGSNPLYLYNYVLSQQNHSYSTGNHLLKMAALTVIPYTYKPHTIRSSTKPTQTTSIT
jgi:hypothetical protein